MIDKKPSRLTGSLEDDDLATPGHDVHGEMHDGIIADDLDDSADADADAMIARQKRNGMMVTYGTGGAFIVVVALMAWPHFKHYFVKPEPVTTVSVGTAVPQTVRKNFFAGSPGDQETDAQQDSSRLALSAPGGSGAVSAKPDTPLATGTNTATAPAEMPVVPLPSPDVSAVAAQPAVTIPASPVPVPPAATPLVPPSVDAVIPSLDAPAATPSADAKALSDEVAKLKTDDDAKTAELDQLKTTLSSLQKQIADLATIKANPEVSVPVSKVSRGRSISGGASPKWQLRSVYNGSAILGRANSGELKHVSVGDLVTGLGKITSIQEQDGHWVVQATDGSVVQ